MSASSPIGIFDSGYGGLTVFKSIKQQLPQYDYIYLGDNARAPYGNRSFETIYEYTRECVEALFDMGCPLVIIACNTSSARALRSIQQLDLPKNNPDKRVLGVIRPTAEVLGNYTKTNHVGVFATQGSVMSNSYVIETGHFFPDVTVHQVACPMWVPLIENNEYNTPQADFFIKKYIDELLAASADIDTILLGCTHYPLIIDKIKQQLPAHIQVIAQGEIVAKSLKDYLYRHSEIDSQLTKDGSVRFFTTDAPVDFNAHATVFFGEIVASEHMAVSII